LRDTVNRFIDAVMRSRRVACSTGATSAIAAGLGAAAAVPLVVVVAWDADVLVRRGSRSTRAMTVRGFQLT
jgi:hypothetical protein